MITKEKLIQFEADIKECFERGEIRAPTHLAGGNEDPLVEIFKRIKPDDWVFSTHRSHYHALLKGVPPELVKREILKGHSITLNFAKYHFFTSAIVGGILPISVGVAMTGQTVWCFVGDMAGRTGIFYECQQYAQGHNLPITFIIEDNGLSVMSPTQKVWGDNVIGYQYERVYPHQGSGKYVIF